MVQPEKIVQKILKDYNTRPEQSAFQPTGDSTWDIGHRGCVPSILKLKLGSEQKLYPMLANLGHKSASCSRHPWSTQSIGCGLVSVQFLTDWDPRRSICFGPVAPRQKDRSRSADFLSAQKLRLSLSPTVHGSKRKRLSLRRRLHAYK